MTRQTPTIDAPSAQDAAAAALAATPTTALMRAAYALTHRMHAEDTASRRATETADTETRGRHNREHASLRAQRDLIDAEILRRTGGQ